MKALFSYLTPLISIAFTLVALFGVVVTQPSGINDPLAPGCMWSTDCELNGCEMGSYCKVVNTYPSSGGFSQCVENLVLVNAKCYPTSNGNYYTYTRRGCADDSQCCNEHAVCGPDRLCHLGCTAPADPTPLPSQAPGETYEPLAISVLLANSTVPFLDKNRSTALATAIANTLDLSPSSVEVVDSTPKRRRLRELYVLTADAVVTPADGEVPTPYYSDRPGLYVYYSSLLASFTIRTILLEEYHRELVTADLPPEPDLKILAIGSPAIPVTATPQSEQGEPPYSRVQYSRAE